jgi:ribosomal protein S18 acetylase RimI-like enzyme
MVEILPFNPSDYDEVMALWQSTEGLTLRDADGRTALLEYLGRNHHLSYVARDRGVLVGAVLAGTDGRRGYLQHLAVSGPYRGQGLGRALAHRALQALHEIGIEKCHLMVRCDNPAAKAFWEHLGWKLRDDIEVMSHVDPRAANA